MGNEKISIRYQVTPTRVKMPSGSGEAGITLSGVTDGRGKDPCLVMDKITLAAGLPAGSYTAQKPVAHIVLEAMSQALEMAGLTPAQDRRSLTLSGRLSALDFSVMVGFSGCALSARLAMDMTLADEATGETLWRETLEGHGRAGVGNLVHTTFCKAMDDFLTRLLARIAADETRKSA